MFFQENYQNKYQLGRDIIGLPSFLLLFIDNW
jgi:hypothetical protein